MSKLLEAVKCGHKCAEEMEVHSQQVTHIFLTYDDSGKALCAAKVKKLKKP